eukprot:NODE_3785_length_1986_cov_6.102205.p1 GENE.NODE_3785_length_1986_cov_6.102205~~NODE_3785_length_1986_cov_6.102205.p1  ORF type:complete len:360 (+),score=118.91 NODE_3785_length_1986_cov_6.102205:775-1854(+)
MISPTEPLLHGGEPILSTSVTLVTLTHLLELIVVAIMCLAVRGYKGILRIFKDEMTTLVIFLICAVLQLPLLLFIRRRCAYKEAIELEPAGLGEDITDKRVPMHIALLARRYPLDEMPDMIELPSALCDDIIRLLGHPRMTNKGILQTFMLLPLLRELSLSAFALNCISGTDLLRVAQALPSIRMLSLDLTANAAIGNEAIIGIAEPQRLLNTLTLILRRNRVITDEGIMKVALAVPKLKVLTLELQGNDVITDMGILGVARTLQNLDHLILDLEDNTVITNKGLAFFAEALPSLRGFTIGLHCNGIITGNKGLMHVAKTLRKLVVLRLESVGTSMVSEEEIALLRNIVRTETRVEVTE